jgi:hypothetical protein
MRLQSLDQHACRLLSVKLRKSHTRTLLAWDPDSNGAAARDFVADELGGAYSGIEAPKDWPRCW